MQDDSGETPTASTGDSRVDQALARLGRVDELPLDEHVALYEDLHEELRNVLSELDDDQGGQPSSGQPQPGSPGPAGH